MKIRASIYYIYRTFDLSKEGIKLKKLLKTTLPVLLIILLSTFSLLVPKNNLTVFADNNDIKLVFDYLNYTNILPDNFRKTSDLTILKDASTLNIKGLDKLSISGSSQFSVNNLALLINAIGTVNPIIDIDLRQESHGFINEYAVSWSDSKNNANAGLTRQEVLIDETNKLNAIKLNAPITIYNHPDKSVLATKVQDENSLVKNKNITYKRITVRDGGIPTDEMVDYFMEVIKNQPENSWIHFHCKHGVGRTSTFMIMYDMVKNYKVASADEIIKRQLALANFKESAQESFYNKERMSFLSSFYDYCQKSGDTFNVNYSEWKKSSNNTVSMSSLSENALTHFKKASYPNAS